MSGELKKNDSAELREYEKRSLVVRAVLATGTLLLSGLTGYLAGKLKRR